VLFILIIILHFILQTLISVLLITWRKWGGNEVSPFHHHSSELYDGIIPIEKEVPTWREMTKVTQVSGLIWERELKIDAALSSFGSFKMLMMAKQEIWNCDKKNLANLSKLCWWVPFLVMLIFNLVS